MIERSVARTPEARIVDAHGACSTYAELNQRSNRLARWLRMDGVGPGTLVGLCLERSVDMLAGILAILKAGGAYIPLDPAHPTTHLDYILLDSGCSIVLAQSGSAESLASGDRKVLHLDRNDAILEGLPSDDLLHENHPNDPAYVIYTSGSTGRPNGVVITHDNVRRFIRQVNQALSYAADDVYLLSASITYALSVRQIMAGFSLGMDLVVPSEREVADPILLLELARRERVTLMDMVPSYWRALNRQLEKLEPATRNALTRNHIRQVMSVGEPLYAAEVEYWQRTLNHPARLVNVYGQTETTGLVCAYPIPEGFDPEMSIVPIGTPAPDTVVYLLDPDLNPVRDGETGEIYIANRSLGLGYLGKPALTAERFVPNPFDDGLSDRMFRTGDIGRRLPDGALAHLGRRDHQIKIRGMRVEKGEIEHALIRDPSIEQAAVEVVQGPVNPVLTAFVVPGTGFDPAAVRDRLRTLLPVHMVPSKYVSLDDFPRTTSGKVDRTTLISMGSRNEEAARQPEDTSGIYYAPSWRRLPLLAPKDTHPETVFVLFTDDLGLADALDQALDGQGFRTVMVRKGTSYAAHSPDRYRIAVGRAADYSTLLAALDLEPGRPLHIIHLWNVTPSGGPPDLGRIDPAMLDGFHSLVFLAQALDGIRTGRRVKIDILSNRLHDILGGEPVDPLKAVLSGPLKVIPMELPGVACRNIDLEDAPATGELLEEILSAMQTQTVGLRNGRRWQLETAPVPAAGPPSGPGSIRPGGVYLVTGGLGSLGLRTAEHIARAAQVRLALLGRTGLPPREAWAALAADGHPRTEVVRRIQAIEGNGSEVFPLQADVTDDRQLRTAFEAIRRAWGKIDGVVHAAGLRAWFRPIRDQTMENSWEVLSAKVHGTLLLEKHLAGHQPLDFHVSYSSLSAVVGRIGQVDGCAANAFLDHFAAFRAMTTSGYKSIGWDVWKGEPMSTTISGFPGMESLLQADMENGLPTPVGLAAFSDILSGLFSQVIVTRRRLAGSAAFDRVPETVDGIYPSAQDEVLKARQSSLAELQLVKIWQEVLGIDRIGLHDNFFDLGGNSLQAAEIYALLEHRHHRLLPLSTLIETPTIAQLALVLDKAKTDEPWSPLVPFNLPGPLPPVFCIPGLGGDVLVFRDLAGRLGKTQPMYAFRFPGLDGKSRPLETIDDLAALLLRHILEIQPAGPYTLLGYSGGGLIAYETARRLLAGGREIDALFVIDAYAPGYDTPRPIQERAAIHWKNLREARGLEKLRYLLDKATKAEEKAEEYAEGNLERGRYEAFARHADLHQILTRASKAYEPELYPGKVTLIRTSEQPEFYMPDDTLGWGKYDPGELEIHEVSGKHGKIMYDPLVVPIADIVRAALAERRRATA